MFEVIWVYTTLVWLQAQVHSVPGGFACNFLVFLHGEHIARFMYWILFGGILF